MRNRLSVQAQLLMAHGSVRRRRSAAPPPPRLPHPLAATCRPVHPLRASLCLARVVPTHCTTVSLFQFFDLLVGRAPPEYLVEGIRCLKVSGMSHDVGRIEVASRPRLERTRSRTMSHNVASGPSRSHEVARGRAEVARGRAEVALRSSRRGRADGSHRSVSKSHEVAPKSHQSRTSRSHEVA